MKRSKVYIAGKVSGLDYNDVVAKFERAQVGCLFHGFKPVLPTQLCDANWGWWRCMVVCLWHLARCKYIYLLPDWADSRGARIERQFAKFLHVKEIQINHENLPSHQ